MDMRDIVEATAEEQGELILPDGHQLSRRADPDLGRYWLIYTPAATEIHFARDHNAEIVRYPTWQKALAEYERLMAVTSNP